MELSNRIEIKTMCEPEDLLTNEVKTYCLKTHFYFENITIYSEQKSSLNCEVSVLLQVRGTEVRDMRLRQLKENEVTSTWKLLRMSVDILVFSLQSA